MTGPTGVTAIVLAGGRSSRFGGPKLAARLDGVLLLDHAIAAVRDLADAVIVAGAAAGADAAPTARPAPATAATPPTRTLADVEPFAGPLAALAGALHATTTDLVILVGGDMPGLQAPVLGAMLQRLASAEDLDAVLLADPATEAPRRQVLPLALRVGPAIAAAAAALGAGDRSLLRLLDRLRSAEIPAATWLGLDPTARTLFDVDRPDDLRRIRREFR